MSVSSRFTRALVSVAVGAALALVVAAPPAVSAPSSTVAPASKTANLVKGTWVGTYVGYEDGKRMKGFEKFVVSKSNGSVVLGTWQFRVKKADAWSAPGPLQWVVSPNADGSVRITGADANGIYVGSMSADGKSLDLSYQGSVNRLVALHFLMTKK